ncbi:methyl-accepting chemotaxis protein [Micavibrio aeruginosavorus]|uniref:Methyl-accepting chemotaxis protein n=1 Tax=Micavibrio aeruginosavorus EPB TaxID=349215 RepID=M4VI93_9BACT|nr:PAS domain-containing methyl-accepting chemotaxis protein [Micavibrio aeruginosavorus]AGH98918.1 Methyl-accepting chemotaxis protein [Micavibrio aeruginosavorus EPB]
MFKKSPFSNKAEIAALERSQAVIRFSPEGEILDANQNFLDVLGYSLNEIKGKHHRMFIDPGYAQSNEYKEFWDTLRRGDFVAAQFKRLAKGGKEIWIEASYNPVKDEKGLVVYVVKYATDITAQKLETADYEGQLSAIGKSQAVIEFDMDGTIITANKNFLTTMGYAQDEVRGKHHSMFVEPSYAKSADYEMFWQKLHRGEFIAEEFQRFGKNGKEVWIQASYNPIFDMSGKPFKVVKYATDVTSAKLDNADYAGQIEAIGKSQAVIEFNLDGTVITANQNFLDALGYTLYEIKGQHHRMFVEREDAQSDEYEAFWANLRQGKFDARVYKRICKNGDPIWIQASYNPIFDMNGKPFKVVKYATDVTRVIQVGGIADEATARTQTVAAAVEEMSASISEISKNMALTTNSTEEIASTSVQASVAADQLMAATKSMEGIIQVIDEIAEQTNLLALNATIEAARAGDAGKGFAVVAGEVKALVGQTAKATEDVTKEIKNVQLASEALQSNIQGVSKSIDTVNKYVAGVASAIEEQSAVTREISSSTQTMAEKKKKKKSRIKRLTVAN